MSANDVLGDAVAVADPIEEASARLDQFFPVSATSTDPDPEPVPKAPVAPVVNVADVTDLRTVQEVERHLEEIAGLLKIPVSGAARLLADELRGEVRDKISSNPTIDYFRRMYERLQEAQQIHAAALATKAEAESRLDQMVQDITVSRSVIVEQRATVRQAVEDVEFSQREIELLEKALKGQTASVIQTRFKLDALAIHNAGEALTSTNLQQQATQQLWGLIFDNPQAYAAMQMFVDWQYLRGSVNVMGEQLQASVRRQELWPLPI